MSNKVCLNSIHTAQDVDATNTVEATLPPAEDHNALPGASASQQADKDISKLLNLPTLAVPTGPLDLEVLMDSLGFESRRNACRQGLDSIAANASIQKQENDNAIAQMKENLAKLEEAKKLQELMKILGIVALVVAAVVTVATLGTAGPVMAAISIALLALTIVSYATDGKVSIAAGFAKLGEACSMSPEDSKLFGFIMEIVIIIATLGVGIGSSLGKGAAAAGAQVAKGAQSAVKTAQEAAANVGTMVAKEASKKVVANLNKLTEQALNNTFKLSKGLVEASKLAKEAGTEVGSFASMPASTVSAVLKEGLKVLLPANARKAAFIAQIVGTCGSGALSAGKGVVAIESAHAESDALRAKAQVRRIDALLTQLREFSDMERAIIKAELERCNALMDSVMRIVHGNNDAQQRILSNSPAMA